MRARRWVGLAVFAVAVAGSGLNAYAEPKPKPVDIKAFRDQLVVLQDADGGIYVVLPAEEPRLWYGLPKKPLYEQIMTGSSKDRAAGTWDFAAWTPRVPNFQRGSVMYKGNGEYIRYCGSDAVLPLTKLSTDKAKAIIDKGPFMTTAVVRMPYLLARDDSGVYYYVDAITKEYGGKGYRVFVGKKGAMKQKPLTDIAQDSEGEVFGTKTGDLRIVHSVTDDGKSTIQWVKGGKKSELVPLDTDDNLPLIYRDLGIYGAIGNICDTL